MTFRSCFASLLLAPIVVLAADENAPSPNTHQLLKSRLAEEAAHKPAVTPAPVTPTAAAVAAENQTQATPTNGADKNPLLSPTADPSKPVETPKPAAPQKPTVMKPIEVNKGRITKLDQDLAREDAQIAREKKNTKPSDLDKTINDAKIAKPLAIFGGESSQFRQHVASERVSLMEDEKDLIEAIAHAKTKEEKAMLQKQLDALRAERRELEKALR